MTSITPSQRTTKYKILRFFSDKRNPKLIRDKIDFVTATKYCNSKKSEGKIKGGVTYRDIFMTRITGR